MVAFRGALTDSRWPRSLAKIPFLSEPTRVQVLPVLSGAAEGTRTLDIQLGKLTLYQLSYSRNQAQPTHTTQP